MFNYSLFTLFRITTICLFIKKMRLEIRQLRVKTIFPIRHLWGYWGYWGFGANGGFHLGSDYSVFIVCEMAY